MAIPPSKLSDLFSECTSPNEMLSKLHAQDLLVSSAVDNEILVLMQNCINESDAEFKAHGFTWATADTRIADKLSRGYLNKKGLEWFKSGPSAQQGAPPDANSGRR